MLRLQPVTITKPRPQPQNRNHSLHVETSESEPKMALSAGTAAEQSIALLAKEVRNQQVKLARPVSKLDLHLSRCHR
jgi:hypothetical protein